MLRFILSDDGMELISRLVSDLATCSRVKYLQVDLPSLSVTLIFHLSPFTGIATMTSPVSLSVTSRLLFWALSFLITRLRSARRSSPSWFCGFRWSAAGGVGATRTIFPTIFTSRTSLSFSSFTPSALWSVMALSSWVFSRGSVWESVFCGARGEGRCDCLVW